ncbi:non-structural maintenance of chromosome element4 [Lichtheimia corymbifera JMRC:FSU:9682]|uniref:Non-structural maintenance of chromosomes element 4 n=1 Tax=Lichtheimia corymbifera JMRC:FSU:9682 TaxID=1263082 RepID=A0A068RVA7_9FUNG|nr:non-structural maintenance of chromosome element4 [Lichtheimia corymbifera JMRC:FSU:9682]
MSNQDQGNNEGNDEKYSQLLRTLEERIDRSKYDPAQDKEVRRMIRLQYRTIIDALIKKKRSLIQPNNGGMIEAIAKLDEIFAFVRNTLEATLDAKALSYLGDYSIEKAKNLQLGATVFDADDFISKVKTFGGITSVREEGNPLDWKAIGLRANQFNNQVMSMDFMYGPLAVEKKQRKQVKQVRIIRNHEDLVQPTQLQGNDLSQQENETSANVNQIYRILDERGPTNLLEFVVNPSSFSQTVENIFYVSFLIRNAVAEIDDSTGQPLLSTRAPPTQEETAQGLGKSQLILNMDMKLWREIVATYGIQNAIIPTRPTTSAALSSSARWY